MTTEKEWGAGEEKFEGEPPHDTNPFSLDAALLDLGKAYLDYMDTAQRHAAENATALRKATKLAREAKKKALLS